MGRGAALFTPALAGEASLCSAGFQSLQSMFEVLTAQLVHKDEYSSKCVRLLLPQTLSRVRRTCSFLFNAEFMPLLFSYDSEGRLTNVTFPTGVVTNLHGDMDKAITVDLESSSREEGVSITSNLSSIDSFYTVAQGKHESRAFNGPV